MKRLICPVPLLIAFHLFCARGAMAGDPTVLWAIGQENRSPAELALVKDFMEFNRRYPDDVRFVVGRSDPALAWPAVQPGPADAWAGSRPHPYTVDFELAHSAGGSYVLSLALVSTHGSIPGELQMDLNGEQRVCRLPRGPGDGALTNPAEGKALRLDLPLEPHLFREGPNRLRLATTGSWVIWDSLRLLRLEQEVGAAVLPDSLHFNVLPLFIRENGSLMQPASLSMALMRPSRQLHARVQVRNRTLESTVKAEILGQVEHRMFIPEITEPTRVTVELRDGPALIYEGTLDVKPSRKWTIHVVPQSHVDIGYTDLQERAMEVHRQSNDLAVKLLQKYPDFLWSVESSYVMNDWLKTRPEDLIEDFFTLTRSNRVEIGAFYGNFLTGLLADEESFRSLYFSKKLSREHGSSFRSATLTDAPSHIWSLPTVLNKSGVKYLSMGINQTRAPLLRQGLDQRSPVWWQGPDGSRILAFFHDHYAGAGRIGLTEAWGGQDNPDAGLQQAEELIPGLLHSYDRPDYPYNSIHIHGAYGDNQPLTEQLPRTVHAWNQKYAWPHIVFSSNEDWFTAIEKEYGTQLKTVSGDGGAFWEDGAGSSALETALNRQNQQEALLAEMLLTGLFAQGKIQEDYRAEFMDIWHLIMLYNEHTWGAHNSISQPDRPEVREQFRYKAQFAHDAHTRLQPLLQKARQALPPAPAASAPPPPWRLEGDTLHTDHYRLRFNLDQGGIASLFDLDADREWVEPNAPHLLGQVIYARNEKPPYDLSTARFRSLQAGPDQVLLQLHHPMMPNIQVVIRPRTSVKGLEFDYTIDKTETYDKEGIYIAFPFATQSPVLDYAVANAVVRAGRDWLPGACKDWFTIQNWVRVQDHQQSLVWVSFDAPLISLQDINANAWLDELPIRNGRVYAYLMNNYWFTNYKAGQDGRLRFRFALTSGGLIPYADAARFGRDWSPAEQQAIDQMVSVQPGHCLVSAFKRSEDGAAYIVRVREMSGQPTRALLRLPAQAHGQAWLASGVEDPLRKLPLSEGVVTLELGAWDVVTIRVQSTP